jgi:hypothetical protein
MSEPTAQLSGLSRQQRQILAAIAALQPEGYRGAPGAWTPPTPAGYYRSRWLRPDDFAVLDDRRRRSASASRARSLARLARRGLLRRHPFGGQPVPTCPYRFFTLTDAGLAVVNQLRRNLGQAESRTGNG